MKLFTALILLVAASVALVIATWQAAAHVPPWRTGGHVVTWYGPDGELVDLEYGCEPVDIGFRHLVDSGGVWTSCTGPGFEHGALAFVDLERGEGHVRWPMPADLPTGDNTVALLPAVDGRLGLVYRVGESGGPLAAAVAGADGWTSAPSRLPGASMTAFLGAAWVAGAFEVVVRPTTVRDEAGSHSPPVIVRLDHGRIEERRPFASAEELYRGLDRTCLADGAQWRDGSWHIFLGGREGEDGDVVVWQVLEDGTRHTTGWAIKGFMISDKVDFAVVGATKMPVLDDRILLADGALAPAPPVPSAGWEPLAGMRDFRVRRGALERIPMWRVPGAIFTVARPMRSGALSTSSTYEIEPPVIRLVEYREGHVYRARPVVHAPGYACGDLAFGTLVPRKRGGYFLEDARGCFITLDEELRRIDPLPLEEHLRRRGSLGLDWNETGHERELRTVLYGAPVGAVFGLGLALIVWWLWRRRGHDGGARRFAAAGITVGLALYLAVAGKYASDLWPLLH